MTISESIKKLRKTYSITQADLGEIVGLSSKAIGAWESGRAEPRIGAIEQIASYFKIPKTKVLGWDEECELNDKETKLIEKYRVLDKYGEQVVDTVLEVEYTRCTDLDFHVRDNVRTINYYLTPASAGPGQILFDDVDVEQISIPDDPEYKRVAYAVGVRGDSMEPAFFDDDILLVEPGPDIRVGEIGIFYVDGQSYIKELGHGELISLNPAYGPIPLNEESRCMGRVVGKL